MASAAAATPSSVTFTGSSGAVFVSGAITCRTPKVRLRTMLTSDGLHVLWKSADASHRGRLVSCMAWRDAFLAVGLIIPGRRLELTEAMKACFWGALMENHGNLVRKESIRGQKLQRCVVWRKLRKVKEKEGGYGRSWQTRHRRRVGALFSKDLVDFSPVLEGGLDDLPDEVVRTKYFMPPMRRSAGNFGSVEKLRNLCKEGRLEEALQAVDILDRQGIPISRDIVYCLLRGCIKKKDLAAGRWVYSLMVRSRLDSVAILRDHLIRLFATCGSLPEANQIFSKVAKPSVYTWSAIISAHAKFGEGERALELYHKMQHSSVKSDKYVYVAVLKACASTADLTQGRLIHAQIITSGLEPDVAVGSTLVDMYAKCGSLEEARKVFDNMLNRNVVSWGAMIGGYAWHGHGLHALKLFEKMQQEGIKSDKATFLSILKACSSIGATEQGRLIHDQIIKRGLESDVVVGSTLVDMYAKCNSLEEARSVFNKMRNRNVVSWGAMIAGYAQHGHGFPALELFENMQQEGITPDKGTFLSILKACGSIGDIKQGILIHDKIIKYGLELDVIVGSTLVDMYAKCGSLQEAHMLFNKLPIRDVVSWGAMIAGYAQHGHGLHALELFKEMQLEGIKPEKVTFLSILKACSSIGAIEQGRLVHDQILKSGLELDVVVGNTLVDMYAKCGSLEEARGVFGKLPNRDVVSWGAMIAGYARYGNYRLAGQCLENMQQEGLRPDDVIFTSILSACSHAGLVNEGRQYFKSMREDYGLTPSIEHYTCMVDLLGRAGCLNEAEDLLKTMPTTPNIIGWKSLLTACRTYGNMELGRRCFDQVVKLDPKEAAGYVLMSNIYADNHMWEDVNKIQGLRKRAGAWKKPGRAWIEVNNKLHEFIVGDKSHSQSDVIYAKLKKLSRLMKEEGYVPHLDLVLQQMSDDVKEDALCGHCEKLAIAFGLVSTPRDTTIRVTKNLRVCTDCHNGTKIISKIERRDIIIKDAYRIHHFKDGACSCGDYY